MTTKDTRSQRQVLVNLGNRYVVFGPSIGLPQKLQFDPERDSELLPRVAYEDNEISEKRIFETLRISNMVEKKVAAEGDEYYSDFVFIDADNQHILVDIKVKDHDPKARDLDSGYAKIREALKEKKILEIWHFNIERLNLFIQAYDNSLPCNLELPPTNVWEKTKEGIFQRDKVAYEVQDWEKRVNALYSEIQNWLEEDKSELRFERSRTVTMSEELMQKFAVSDKELPILDVVYDKQVLASFIPRGLWLIGAWGRIDVITQKQTKLLVAIKQNGEQIYEWKIASPDSRQTQALTKDSLLSILAQ